jgi:hypothetical protein
MKYPVERLTRPRTLAAEIYAIVYKAIDRRPVPTATTRTNSLRYGDNVPGTASPAFNIIDLADGDTAYDDGAVLTSTATGWEWTDPVRDKVSISTGDTPGFLEDKLIAGTGITLTVTGSTDKIITVSLTGA